MLRQETEKFKELEIEVTDRIEQIEQTVKSGNHIFIVTANLIEEDELKEIVKRNIDRGVYYTYFFPKRLDKSTQMNRLDSFYNHSKYVSFIPLENDEFNLVFPMFNVIIFNPSITQDYVSEREFGGYVCLGLSKSIKKLLWQKINEFDCTEITNKLKKSREGNLLTKEK